MRDPRLLITIIHHNLGPFLDDGPLIHVLARLNRIGAKRQTHAFLSVGTHIKSTKAVLDDTL